MLNLDGLAFRLAFFEFISDLKGILSIEACFELGSGGLDLFCLLIQFKNSLNFEGLKQKMVQQRRIDINIKVAIPRGTP